MNLLGKPTIEFCERAGSGLIKRPFYALSAVVYLFAGLAILKHGKGSRLSKKFAYMIMLVGLFSFMYDATYTYLSQLVDLFGMLIFVNLIININLEQIFSKHKKYTLALQSIAVVIGILAIIIFGSVSGEFVFGIFVITSIILELYLLHKTKRPNFKLWILGFSFFISGFIIWLLDYLKIYCDPNNYINGRGVFHLLTALAAYYLYKYYDAQEQLKIPGRHRLHSLKQSQAMRYQSWCQKTGMLNGRLWKKLSKRNHRKKQNKLLRRYTIEKED